MTVGSHPPTTSAASAVSGAAGPPVTDHDYPGRDGERLNFRGRCLGFASSRRDEHDHPVTYDSAGRPITFSEPGTRCSACRWFEVWIFSVEAELVDECTCAPDYATDRHQSGCGQEPPRGHYLLLTAGRTVVPDEVDKRRSEWTDSPFKIVELLTQRGQRGGERTSFLPIASAHALADAAQWDDGVRDAYVNRAVT